MAQVATSDKIAIIEGAEVAVSEAPRRERGERGDGARRERGGRRNERRPASDEGSLEAPAAVDETAAQDGIAVDAAPQDGQEPARNGQRRSRDRYGRERRGRGDNTETAAGENQDAAPQASAPVETVETSDDAPVRSYFTRTQDAGTAPTPSPAEPAPAPQVLEVAATPVVQARAVVVEPAPAASAPTATGLPKVVPFTLEVDALAHIAQASGLSWVHSDQDKVQQAQAAIAAEPKPIHVPREPKPVVALDEGPLVLVETRRDLRNMVLPFEQQQAAGPN